MQIAICDHDDTFREELHRIIVEYKQNRKLPIDICEFENGEDLLSSNFQFDLVFLGYQFPQTNGMAVAKELRSRRWPCGIVFITHCPDFVYDSFEVRPYRFFIKPVQKDKIHAMLTSFFAERNRMLTILKDGERKVVPPKDIIYLEGNGKHCIIRTVGETLNSSKTLSEVYACLSKPYFFRIHKSYAVNMNYIRSIDDQTVTFINGEKASISRARLPDFKNALKLFTERYAGLY